MKMKNISKQLLFIVLLLSLTLFFYNKIESEIWLSVRIPLLGGLILALIMTIPYFDFSKPRKLIINLVNSIRLSFKKI